MDAYFVFWRITIRIYLVAPPDSQLPSVFGLHLKKQVNQLVSLEEREGKFFIFDVYQGWLILLSWERH